MGITGFYKFLKDNCPQELIDVQINFNNLRGKRVAIDANAFVYKFLYGRDKNYNYIIQFVSLYVEFLNYKIDPIFIFDGKPHLPKQEHAKKDRKEKEEKNKKTIETLEINVSKKRKRLEENENLKEDNDFLFEFEKSKLELQRLKDSFLKVTPEIINMIKTVLSLLGAKIYSPDEGDSEGFCSVLNRLGYVDYVVSEDGDTFLMGAENLIRGLKAGSNRDNNLRLYHIPSIIKHLKLESNALIDLGILSGCDYADHIDQLGITKAYKCITTYNKIEENFLKEFEQNQLRIKNNKLKTHEKKLKKTFVNQDDIDFQIELYNEKLFSNDIIPKNYYSEQIEKARSIFYYYRYMKELPEELLFVLTQEPLTYEKFIELDNKNKLIDYIEKNDPLKMEREKISKIVSLWVNALFFHNSIIVKEENNQTIVFDL